MTNKESSPGLFILTDTLMAEILPYDLYDMGAVAVETRDNTTMNIPDQSDMTLLIAGFSDSEKRDAAKKTLMQSNKELLIESTQIEDDGWSEGWKRFFKPVILDTMQVITPWMEPPHKNLNTIIIDPGQAFGTGGHATTRLILSFLEKEDSIPDKILDVGTGSGVLSIACAKMGSSNITAFDIDENCKPAVLQNAAKNRVEKNIDAFTAEPKDISGKWPLVLANIQLAVFLKTAKEISALVEDGGKLIISGILVDQLDDCIKLWPGFKVIRHEQEDEWIALVLVKD
ncbi:MAG: 50S ribosomal protein L11 methyltransferase [Deltaproteobacteria bacterium]|nr:50S ribosomal protein L11 methyltransferase [Deltaproteobacteria bacterium]